MCKDAATCKKRSAVKAEFASHGGNQMFKDSAAYKERSDVKDGSVKHEVPFVDLKAQYSAISSEVDREIKEVLKNCDFILGGKVEAFEDAFARFCGVNHAVGVASGTEALHLALEALGVGEGTEVITQANTFIATALAISYTGARPVLVDIDPCSSNIDINAVEEAVTERTRAIIPVHIYGRVADMDALKDVAVKNNLFIAEDACQAHGAFHHGREGIRAAGSIGDIAAFSFYPGKNLGAYGDGGMVTTNDLTLAGKVRMLRNYGQTAKYHHPQKGFNSRLDTIQAAVLLAKLSHLREWNALRIKHARRYTELLKDLPEVTLPEFGFDSGASVESPPHVFHLYVIRVADRDGLAKHLKARSISTGIHYPVPIHMQGAYAAELGYRPGDFPVTEEYAGRILSLPMFPEMTDAQIEHVASSIREYFGA